MPSSVIIRSYTKTDREACRSLWRELTQWHREIYQDQSIGGDHPEEIFDKLHAAVGNERLWVAEMDSEVVGLIGLMVERPAFQLHEECSIEPIVVTREHRGKGIGSLLLERVITEAQKLGVVYLNVRPVMRNQRTIQFFHKNGFQNLGSIELFYSFKKSLLKSRMRLFNRNFRY